MMPKINSKFWIAGNKLKGLKSVKLLKHLISVHSDFNESQISNGKWMDCSYWYSERPQVGWLSAAIWLAKGISLEEYRVNKKKF